MPQTPETARKRVYRGTGYWVLQIVGSIVLTVLCAAAGWFVLLAPDEVLSLSDEPAERGPGVMALLCSLAFLATFVWVVRKGRSSSQEQRAVYAWVVMQLHASHTAIDDFQIMRTAASARAGELTAEQIGALKALRPDVPYPGRMPAEPTEQLLSTGRRRHSVSPWEARSSRRPKPRSQPRALRSTMARAGHCLKP